MVHCLMLMSTLRVLTADHKPTSKHYAKSCVNTACLLHTWEYKVLKVPRPALSLHLGINWVEEVFVSFRMSCLGKREREKRKRQYNIQFVSYLPVLHYLHWNMGFKCSVLISLKDLVHWWLNSRNLQAWAITFKMITKSSCLSFPQKSALAIMDN